MDISSWIQTLPSPTDWPESDAQLDLQLATANDSTTSILFKAERTSGSDTEALVTFSVSLQGFFHLSANPNKTLWVSNPFPLSPQNSILLHLLHQLAQETISRAPTTQDSITPPFKLDPEPISRAFRSTLADPSFSRFFNLVFSSRLFWLCVCDAPAEAGSLFFQAMAPSLHTFLQCKPAMSAFLAAVGADGELLFMRALGYMLAKWLILREVGGVLSSSTPTRHLSFSYARESHGLWILKGYAPVTAMKHTRVNGQRQLNGVLETKESVLKYALAHQQLEAVIQLEHSVSFHDRFIRVGVRLDNVRLHVTRLVLGAQNGEGEGEGEGEQPYAGERHFPNRVRVSIGPAAGSSMGSSLTLGRSTENPVVEVDTCRSVKGGFGKSKSSSAKAAVRSSTRVKRREWRWEQDAEGNSAVFQGVLCSDPSGAQGLGWNGEVGPRGGVGKRRWVGGLVFAGDEHGEEVSWRVGREEMMMMMSETNGGDLKWRIGGKVWLSYWPSELKTSYHDTRCVEWSEEVKLPLADHDK